MNKTVSTKETYLRRLFALASVFEKQGDVVTKEKALELLGKCAKDELTFAFCGHFSAGKSSMINALLGANILPSSPIPTSANLVKIIRGDSQVKLLYRDGTCRVIKGAYDDQKVKSLCKDGESIKSIEISYPTKAIPSNGVLMDTPGIDSTDEAHSLATESAIHLADVCFYVMDYNHVMSEMNFLFTREWQKSGKELYLIINQIDKHKDDELDYKQFQNEIITAFHAGGVYPAGFFYTTLKKLDHPHNEFLRLEEWLKEKWLEKKRNFLPSIQSSMEKLVEDHKEFLRNKFEEVMEPLKELRGLSIEEQRRLKERFIELEHYIQELESDLHKKEKEFSTNLERILANAYLMPFETREFAKEYLQSRQPDFKVGFLFSKNKTDEERKARLQRFYDHFQEKIKTQLTWHIKDYFVQLAKVSSINEPKLLHEMQEFDISFSKDFLEQAVKTGARLSGEYVLQYSDDVLTQLRRIVNEQTRGMKDTYLSYIRKKVDEERQKFLQDLAHVKKLLCAWEQLSMIEEEMNKAVKEADEILSTNMDDHLLDTEISAFLAKLEEVHSPQMVKEGDESEEIVVPLDDKKSNMMSILPNNEKNNLNSHEEAKTITMLRRSAELLEELPGFQQFSRLLKDKAARLEKRTFTVALFGAFSAGKSSFANSLLGEKLLPVSPNPTTAAINKILPVDDFHPHGLVKVRFKQENALLEDVNQALRPFSLFATDIPSAIQIVVNLIKKSDEVTLSNRKQISFLNAFYKGINVVKERLGEEIHIDIQHFSQYVAEEEKSCFVEWIEVYYDCPLTRQGIILVDTPGADSIHARHTEVAFEYIKNADAILFITYYNHAFAKADREFLLQLGRVKDSFSVDKMFFIINAIDLAANDSEKQEVLSYVHDQLVKLGIRHPHIYPLSSLLALKAKKENRKEQDAGLAVFEQDFFHFINSDLMSLSVRSAMNEWTKAHEQLLHYMKIAKEDKNLQEQKLEEFKKESEQILTYLEEQFPEWLQKRMVQEIEELVYYIKQRVFYRFNDFFRESFNPAVLKDDGRNMRRALDLALDEFLHDFGFDFAQELRATTLRVETFLTKLLADFFAQCEAEVHQINSDLLYSEIHFRISGNLTFENAFVKIERSIFKPVLSHFKNPKAFFEKNGKKLMMDELTNCLQKPADQYLEKAMVDIISYYERKLTDAFHEIIKHMQQETIDYYQGLKATLDGAISLERLQAVERELNHFSMNGGVGEG